jgi:hypothetical protein
MAHDESQLVTADHPMTLQQEPVGAADLSARNSDLILRALHQLQRQQQEQTRLLRQLMQDVAQLQQSQTQQETTVTKLDRRMRRARLWRLTWFVLRWVAYLAVVGSVIYLIGWERIVEVWQRLVWLLT